MEKAKEFVEKFFSDDDFMAKIIFESGMYTWSGEKGNHISDDEQNKAIAEAAKKNGYDITPEDYKVAMKEYFEGIGTMNTVKKVFHLAKIARKVAKENK